MLRRVITMPMPSPGDLTGNRPQFGKAAPQRAWLHDTNRTPQPVGAGLAKRLGDGECQMMRHSAAREASSQETHGESSDDQKGTGRAVFAAPSSGRPNAFSTPASAL